MDDLLRFNFGQRYLSFDTETEGLNLINDRPFQLAWQLSTVKGEIQTGNRLIRWPDLKMSADAAKITRFDRGLYDQSSIDPKEAWNEFKKILYDPSVVLICQNFFNFDVYMLRRLQIEAGEKPDFSYMRRIVDTKCVATAIKKGLPFNPQVDKDFLAWQYRVGSIVEKGLKTSLITLLKEYEIPVDESRLHEALYDVQMMFEVFKKMIWKVEIPNLAVY